MRFPTLTFLALTSALHLISAQVILTSTSVTIAASTTTTNLLSTNKPSTTLSPTTSTKSSTTTSSSSSSTTATTTFNPDSWKGEGIPTERCVKDWCSDIQGLEDVCKKSHPTNATRALECFCDLGNGRGSVTQCINRCYTKATPSERKPIIDKYNKMCPAYIYTFPGDNPSSSSSAIQTVYGYERGPDGKDNGAASGRLLDSLRSGEFGMVGMVVVMVVGMVVNGM